MTAPVLRARSRGRGVSWSPEEEAMVRRWYHLEPPGRVAARVSKVRGVPRTAEAVKIRAQRLGLKACRSPEDWTVEELAKVLGVGRWHVDRLVRRGLVRTVGRGKSYYIDGDDVEKVAAMYPPPPERSMTKTQAMRRLGYSETHITKLLRAGLLRGVRRGERWFVDADHVEQLAAEFRRAGTTRKMWGEAPGLEPYRAACRENMRRRRSQTPTSDLDHLAHY